MIVYTLPHESVWQQGKQPLPFSQSSKCLGETPLSAPAAVRGLEPKVVGIQMRQCSVFPARLVLRMLTATLSCARILKVSCVKL